MAALAAHPHIVTILDAGVHEGRPWIAMELCRRGALSTVEPMDVHVVLDVLIATARAMDAAHGLGVLHCDLKPANILTTDFGSFAVADFGIARTASSSTTTAGSGYSLDYAAPEVLDGQAPTVATDVYCLGATAWALLSGRRPFRDAPDTPASTVAKRILLEPLPPASPRTPVQLATLIADMTRKNPAERVGSMAEVARRAQAIRDQIVVGQPSPVSRPPNGTPIRPAVPSAQRGEHDAGDDTVYRVPRTGPSVGSPPDGADPARHPTRNDRPAHILIALTGVILVGLVTLGALSAFGVVAPSAPSTTTPTTGAPPTLGPSSTPRPAPSTAAITTATDDLALPTPAARPACDGRFIVLVGSAVNPERYRRDVAALLAKAPGTSYVLTAHSCGSFQDRTASGDFIYAVYLGPFDTADKACAARTKVGGKPVRQLSNMPATKFPSC